MDEMTIGFLFGTATTLIGGLAAHFLGKDIARRNEFNKAAKEFISAFQEELTKLRLESPSVSIYDIIYPVRIKHGQAYAFFCRHLRGGELEQFRRAWKEYYVLTPTHPGNEEDSDEDIILLVEKIENLFKFAKYK
ncbi:MAG: hypothetical protein JSW07_14685 [bacterium]|nr:MAG: hypothetical protein JSW07_14685 [bacterium]